MRYIFSASKGFLIFAFLLFAQGLWAQMQIDGQVGKRWLHADDGLQVSNHSFLFSLLGNYAVDDVLSLQFGSTWGIDHFGNRDSCSESSSSCASLELHKVLVELGMNFRFGAVSLFVQGGPLVYGWGKEKVWGTSSQSFARSSPLSVFEKGQQQGELIHRMTGFDVRGGLKWSLTEKLSCLFSLEYDYEKQMISEANVKITTARGDRLELSTSHRKGWFNTSSSAIFTGLSYSL